MNPPRIVTSFSKYSDGALETKAREIATAMSDNPNFPEPDPSLQDILASIANYSEALSAALEGGRVNIALKNDARSELESTLMRLASYVTYTSASIRTMLVSSGFTMAKSGEPAPPITAPQNLVLSAGPNRGEIVAKVDRVPGAISYVFEYAKDPIASPNDWIQIPTTTCKYVIKGLESITKYWVRVAAIGPKNQKVYSSELFYVTQ